MPNKAETKAALEGVHQAVDAGWFKDRGAYSQVVSALETALTAWDEDDAA